MKASLVHRFPFFYGWPIMAAGILGVVFASPGQTYALSMLIEHFMEDLKLGRSEVSGLYTVATLAASLGLPAVGRWIDRVGSRRAATLITLLFGLFAVFLGLAQNALMLILGFTLLRLLGPGALCLVSTNVINQWWVKRRGKVMGITGLVTSLCGIGLFPPIIESLVTALDWRATLCLLGLGIILVMLPVSAILLRDKPELYGLLPDGAREPSDFLAMGPGTEADWTHAEAIRTLSFWLVTLGLSTLAMMITGLHFHAVSLFEAGGHSRALAAGMFMPIAVTSAFIGLLGGILKDRISAHRLLACALVLLGLSLLLARELHGLPAIFVYSVALGATGGLFQLVSGVVWADFFGRRHLAEISGRAITFIVAGSALGPLPLGLAKEHLGSFGTALEALSLPPILLAAGLFFMAPPRR